MTRVAIAGAGLYAPGYPNLKAWREGAPDPERPAATGELIDKRTRRRASLLTRSLADAFGEALQAAELDPATVGSVFGSALGEAGTMISLLDQMWRGDGSLSPMRFATSVHNAAAGVVSITTKNRGFTTSLGADHDTPAMALYEAMAFALAHDEPVMVACGDEAAPADLVQDGQGWDLLACAVALVPESQATHDMPRIGMPRIETASLPAADLSPELSRNPNTGLLDLIDAADKHKTGTLRLDRGRGRGYCVQLHRPA